MASGKKVTKSKLVPITKGKAQPKSTLTGDLKALKQMADSANARAALLNHLVASLTQK